METVDTASHVITELWKLPADKSLSCLLGNMESCEDEIVIGEENETRKAFDSQTEIVKSIVKAGEWIQKLINSFLTYCIVRLPRLPCTYE